MKNEIIKRTEDEIARRILFFNTLKDQLIWSAKDQHLEVYRLHIRISILTSELNAIEKLYDNIRDLKCG